MMRLNITLRSVLLLFLITLYNLNIVVAQSCVNDITAPTIIVCTSDTVVTVSEGTCDTNMTFLLPAITDACDQIGFADDFAPGQWSLEQFGAAGNMDGTYTDDAPNSLSITGAHGDLVPPFDLVESDTIKLCKVFPVSGMVTFSWNAVMTGSKDPIITFGNAVMGQFLNDESWYEHNGVKTDLATTGTEPVSGGPINILVNSGDSICFYVRSNNGGDYDSLTITDWNFSQSKIYPLSPDPVSTTPMDATFNVELGLNLITWEAIDSSGNARTCTFTVEVLQAVVPQAACRNINLSLDSICQTEVIPEMLYTGDTINGFCNNAFSLIIKDQWGNIIPDNIVDGSYSGQTLDYDLYINQSGNHCWGTILVEDKYPPQIVCSDDTMNCYTFQHDFIPPAVIDNCSQAEAILLDEILVPSTCDPEFIKTITQTWYAKDVYGNESSTCKQVVRVRRFPIGAVVAPVSDTSIDCRVKFKKLANGAPDPSVSGVPTYNGRSIYPFGDAYCNVFVSFRDLDFQETGCTKKIVRLWTVSELWCNREVPRFFTQTIKIVDTSGPIVTLPRTFLEATTESRSCSANIWLPEAQYFDECHDIEGIIIRYPGGILKTNGGLITLPVGRHTVEYDVFDKCYNHTSKTLEVIIRDLTAPVAVCHSHTTIGINNLGFGDVLAKEFDDGSFDECRLDSMQVRRMGSTDPCGVNSNEWGRTVRFCCDDIGKTILVGFRVWDASGNHNDCMVSVEVQDKIAPTIICPPNITVDCRFDWDPNHLEIFGELVSHDSLRKPITIHSDTLNFDGPAFDGVAYDNCPLAIDTATDLTRINNCGTGYILRFFTITDAQGQESHCTQRITFVQKDTFDLSNIDWPNDYHAVDSCDQIDLFNPNVLPDSSAQPRYTMEDECSLVGASYKDDTLRITVNKDACFKIIRHWKVIDWCQNNNGVFERWTHDQILKMTNSIAPIITSGCTDTVKCFYNNDCSGGPITLTETAIDDCTPENELFWQYRIDLGNDGSWDIFGRDSNTLTRSFPIDTHRIEWQVEDKCGNIDKCDYLFEARNCKAPTAYCKNSLIVELTPVDTNSPPDGIFDIEETTIWATDLDEGSSHVCGYPVVLSFSADTSDTNRTYDCDSLGIRDVEIWVTDLVNGNTSVCKTTVQVQDNNNVDVCPANLTGIISGFVATEKDKMISSVNIDLEGANGMKVKTDKNGSFTFPAMPLGSSYKIVPTRDDDYMNGVSTRDLVAIQKHLLGISKLNSPYQLIAADANRSNSVSTRDISVLRKLILGRIATLPNVTSWRFVEKKFNFQDPNNPFLTPFPESHDLDPFMQDIKMDFVGVKVGDVNGDIKLDNFGNTDTRGNESMDITIAQNELQAYEYYDLAFNIKDLQSYEGYQFSLMFDIEQIEIIEVVPNENIEMGLANFNLEQIRSGIIHTSWSSLALNLDKTLFTLKVRSLKDVKLNDIMHISSSKLDAEAYGIDGSLQRINLIFERDKAIVYDEYFALFQNEPNPFISTTTIKFHLPKDQEAILTLYDQTGKVIYVIKDFYAKGMNEIVIDRNDVLAVGTLFYQLDTEGQTATRRMVIMNY